MEPNEASPAREAYNKVNSDVAKWIDTARIFWTTRRAVLQGKSLWDYGDEKKSEEKIVGPWKFNILQSVITGSIVGFSTKLINLLMPQANKSGPLPFPDNPAFSKLFETT